MNEWTPELEAEFGSDARRLHRTQHGPFPVGPDKPTMTLDKVRQLIADDPLLQREYRLRRMRGTSYGNRWNEDLGIPNV